MKAIAIPEEDVAAISRTIRDLLMQMKDLCDHIAYNAPEDEEPPECFIRAFATLKEFLSHSEAHDLIEKAKHGPH